MLRPYIHHVQDLNQKRILFLIPRPIRLFSSNQIRTNQLRENHAKDDDVVIH